MDRIYKLQPHRTMQLQGFNAYGAAAALWGASDTGFTVSGVFRDAADFAVLQLWEQDDYYGHPRWSYLPDSDFTGIVLDFEMEFQGIFPFESKKQAWTDCQYLNGLLIDGTPGGRLVQKPLIELATDPGGRSGASGTLTLNSGGPIHLGDRVTLCYQYLAFDFIAQGGETTETICQSIADQINKTDWTQVGPVALKASSNGNQITISAEPGSDGNMVTFYELHNNTNLFFTPKVLQLSGGSSDHVKWHFHIDFSTLGWGDPASRLNIQKLWLTFAPSLANSAAYQPTEWQVTVTNWTVTDTQGVRALKVAGPGSVRIEEDDSWVSRIGYWEDPSSSDPPVSGFWSQGRAIRSAYSSLETRKLTIETHCQYVHDIYLGTRLDSNCGIISATLDGGSPVTLDCYSPAPTISQTRRCLFSNVPAGRHCVAISLTGHKNPASEGWYFYFDFLECVIANDVPDPVEQRMDVAIATDFDTDHTYKCSPQRVVWAIQKSGLLGHVDHYAGVFWWKQAIAVGGSIPTAEVVCDTSSDAFVTINDWILKKTIYPEDTPQTVAAHFAYYINAAASGVWADTDGNGTLRIYERSAAFNTDPNRPAFTCKASGGATLVSDFGQWAMPTWQIDPNANPIFNRAFRDWHADFFATLKAAGMGAVVAFSQELVNAPDNPPDGVWYQRFWDQTPVQTDTGFQNLKSSQCTFSAAVQQYLKQAYESMAGLMEAAGLTPRLQFGEILWWFFPGSTPTDTKGMAYYDADTQSAFEAGNGRPLARFLTPNDDPSVNQSVDAKFLQSRLAAYVQGIQSYVLARHPNALFELLWPLDVNVPETKRLNWYVNLPSSWKQKNGSGFSSFLCEGFQFGGVDRDVDEVSRCAAYPFSELAWTANDCGYLMGLFNPGWPWQREFLAASRRLPSVIKMWAYDQICLYGRAIPLPAEAKTSTIQTGG